MRFTDAIRSWLAGDRAGREMIERHNIPFSQVSPSSLPPQYGDAKFEGVRVVDGKFCRTVAEYNKAHKDAGR